MMMECREESTLWPPSTTTHTNLHTFPPPCTSFVGFFSYLSVMSVRHWKNICFFSRLDMIFGLFSLPLHKCGGGSVVFMQWLLALNKLTWWLKSETNFFHLFLLFLSPTLFSFFSQFILSNSPIPFSHFFLSGSLSLSVILVSMGLTVCTVWLVALCGVCTWCQRKLVSNYDAISCFLLWYRSVLSSTV